jgi:hypothetical protein
MLRSPDFSARGKIYIVCFFGATIETENTVRRDGILKSGLPAFYTAVPCTSITPPLHYTLYNIQIISSLIGCSLVMRFKLFRLWVSF